MMQSRKTVFTALLCVMVFVVLACPAAALAGSGLGGVTTKLTEKVSDALGLVQAVGYALAAVFAVVGIIKGMSGNANGWYMFFGAVGGAVIIYLVPDIIKWASA